MYGTNIVGSGLSLGKVLSGISKGLSIANQVIPIYQQAKPMISNARKVLQVVKEFKETPAAPKSTKTTIEAKAKPKENITKKASPTILGSPNSMPVFFQ